MMKVWMEHERAEALRYAWYGARSIERGNPDGWECNWQDVMHGFISDIRQGILKSGSPASNGIELEPLSRAVSAGDFQAAEAEMQTLMARLLEIEPEPDGDD